MFLLALDTCDAKGSVALLRDASVLQSIAHDTPDDYSSWLLPAVQRVLQDADVALVDVDAYAAATGPGSFTGVRAALTTVKAWAEVYGRPIVGVSRLEALGTEASGEAPYVAAVADARRNQIFGAIYRRGTGELQCVDEETVSDPDSFVSRVVETAAGDRIDWISPDPQCIAQTQLWCTRQAGGETLQTASPILAPAIGRLGYRRAMEKRFTDVLALDANYVRRSDAEVLWKDPHAR